jgi:hypothetical protein
LLHPTSPEYNIFAKLQKIMRNENRFKLPLAQVIKLQQEEQEGALLALIKAFNN